MKASLSDDRRGPDGDEMPMALDAETDPVMLDSTTRVEPNSVVVGVDDSPGGRRALAWARRHGAAIGPLVAVTCPSSRRSHAGEMLVDLAADAQLLVVGSRGRGRVAGMVLGSTSSYCAHHSRVPVAIVPDGIDPQAGVDSVAVGVDGSENSVEALRWALRFAPLSARIDIHFAWMTPPVAQSLTGPELERVREASSNFIDAVVDRVVLEEGALDRSIVRHLAVGDPSRVLTASSASWIVTGARSETGLTAFVVHSAADSLAHASGAVVVLVPPSGQGKDQAIRHVG
jgi:nucleotide-binding universal stress UspA family protein